MNESYHITMKGQPGKGIVGYNKLSMVIDKILRLQAEAGIDPKELEIFDGDTMKKIPGDVFLKQHEDLYDPFESLTEAPINIPDYKSDDMGYVRSVYQGDHTGNKYSDKMPSIKLGKIPGFELEHEMFKDENGNINIYHSIDPYEDPKTFQDKLKKFGKEAFLDKSMQRKPLSFVSVRPYRDGYIGNTVATDPNQRDKGIASKLIIALIDHLDKPFYFGRQTSPAGKQFTDSIIRKTKGKFRAVGYDQTTGKDFDIDSTADLYTDVPGFSQDPTDYDSYDNRDVANALTKTKLIKLIPENWLDPRQALREILKEAKQYKGINQQQVASLIVSMFNDRDTGIDVAKEFLDVVWDLTLTNIKDRSLLSDPMAMTPIKYRRVQPPKRKSYTDLDVETVQKFMDDSRLPIKIQQIRVDVTSPPKEFGKNTLLFDLEADFRDSALQEQANEYLDLKGFVNLIYRQTGKKDLAVDFYHGNNRPEFAHLDDAGTSTALYTVDDALDDDKEMVNSWLKQNNIPQIRVDQIILSDDYEPHFILTSMKSPQQPRLIKQ